ncbi:hypothetical protein BH10PLA2_BH10PLA2_22560 [soil metagenome]
MVGSQAREYVKKDPQSVVTQFKRKMGTTERFKIKSLGQSKTPIELSAFVLKELRTFIHTGENPEAVVITVPASFDMVQSNATKEAGMAAGFKQVVLLQEPIAASLAYANKEKAVDLKNSQWIVYDLGGGTFDVALVRIVDGDLKILDHEGDNYLGGSDFEALMVEKIIVPQLEKKGKFTNLLAQLKSETGKYNRQWCRLILDAEQAKIELSTKTSAEIEFSMEDDEANPVEGYVTVTRSEFEAVIKEAVDKTAELLQRILTRNSLRAHDLKFILMVGGATYSPFVRKRIEELLGIPVNTGINPTNAIAIGAAYYAANKEIGFEAKPAEKPTKPNLVAIKVSYNRASQEREELFSAKIDGDVTDRFYRITREDGGYDSGLKKLANRIAEDLPLQEDAYNLFAFTIYDSHNKPVPCACDVIQIAQGKYSVAGQVLPHDLSLVKDDTDSGDTKLDCIFEKNALLPAKAKRTVEVSKTISQNSVDDAIRVIVVEGPPENHFTANRKQGELVINGKQLKRDLLRGTDIDLTFELSESRDLSVTAYINPAGPEFSVVFQPKYREVNVDGLAQEIQMLESRLEEEKADAIANEKYEIAEKLEKLCGAVKSLLGPAMLMTLDDVTDEKFKLDEDKRRIAQTLDQLTAGKRLESLRDRYESVKNEVTELASERGNDYERNRLRDITSRERVFLLSKNPKKLEAEIDQLETIRYEILIRTPSFLQDWFDYLVGKRGTFNDEKLAANLIEAGKKHRTAEEYEKLAEVNGRLHRLVPDTEDVKTRRLFTGIR